MLKAINKIRKGFFYSDTNIIEENKEVLYSLIELSTVVNREYNIKMLEKNIIKYLIMIIEGDKEKYLGILNEIGKEMNEAEKYMSNEDKHTAIRMSIDEISDKYKIKFKKENIIEEINKIKKTIEIEKRGN